MSDSLLQAIESLVRKAPAAWLQGVCDCLRNVAPTASSEFVLQKIPGTSNADLYFLISNVISRAKEVMSWEALSWTFQVSARAEHRLNFDQQVELLWSGPNPANRLPARRIDQALYDLIASAQQEILLVTFAATKIERLAEQLIQATSRGVKVKLILEFQETSEGQLSFDALKAFPKRLVEFSEIYAWPLDKRDRNAAGKPGKLHAKIALIDEVAIVSSANLTDDAFTRNFEIGMKTTNREFVHVAREHLNSMIQSAVLTRIGDP